MEALDRVRDGSTGELSVPGHRLRGGHFQPENPGSQPTEL
jgi:hypothetical protein